MPSKRRGELRLEQAVCKLAFDGLGYTRFKGGVLAQQRGAAAFVEGYRRWRARGWSDGLRRIGRCCCDMRAQRFASFSVAAYMCWRRGADEAAGHDGAVAAALVCCRSVLAPSTRLRRLGYLCFWAITRFRHTRASRSSLARPSALGFWLPKCDHSPLREPAALCRRPLPSVADDCGAPMFVLRNRLAFRTPSRPGRPSRGFAAPARTARRWRPRSPMPVSRPKRTLLGLSSTCSHLSLRFASGLHGFGTFAYVKSAVCVRNERFWDHPCP